MSYQIKYYTCNNGKSGFCIYNYNTKKWISVKPLKFNNMLITEVDENSKKELITSFNARLAAKLIIYLNKN